MSDLLVLLRNRGLSPRKNSTNHGGEYCSPCPVCGDGGKGKESNRFHVWPRRETGGKCVGRFWCRQCGVSGDTISFLQQVDGLSFQEACAELGVLLPQQSSSGYSRYQAAPVTTKEQEPWAPRTYAEPGPVWMEKAGNLLADCQRRLTEQQDALAWLAERGITADIARAYGLGYNLSSKGKDRYRPRQLWDLPEKHQGGKQKKMWIPRGWVIPAFSPAGALIQLRVRRLNEDVAAFGHEIKYYPLDGSSMATMVLHPEAEVFAVVECGFDAILLAALMEGKIGAITTWNSAARPDVRAHGLLSKASLILGALDYDNGGDREQDWWTTTYRQYRRLPALPGGAKDPGDAAKDGVDIKAWLLSGMPRGLQIKLGFSGKATSSRPQAAKHTPPVTVEQPAPAEVVELELTGGTVVYVTNDQQAWSDLAGQGKPVFSQNELERLKIALAGLTDEERVAAILRTIEAKETFGGYILHGRQGDDQLTECP